MIHSFLEKDHYERLGVSKTAVQHEIKSAYRRLARIHHPDVCRDKKQAEENFVLLNEAYTELSDSVKREAYDIALSRKKQIEAFAQKSSKVKEDLGKRASAMVNPFKTKVAEPLRTVFKKKVNLDARATIAVSLEDAIGGTTQSVTVDCRGGSRFKHSSKVYRVNIPQGIWEGQQLRLKGCGFEDRNSDDKGDLFLTLEYKEHKRFSFNGEELFANIDVNPWVAKAGGLITETFFGKEYGLQISQGVKSGEQIKIQGLGMPKADGTRGVLIVTLNVHMTGKFTENPNDVWEEIAV